MPPLFRFPIAKGGTKTMTQLSIKEGLSFQILDMRIYNYKLRNEKFFLSNSTFVTDPSLIGSGKNERISTHHLHFK
jgi:hypothetical protein